MTVPASSKLRLSQFVFFLTVEGIYERLDALDASAAKSRATSILHGLGFTTQMQHMKTREFSGGWRMRVALARALFLPSVECLILDEPTNHLGKCDNLDMVPPIIFLLTFRH